MDAAEAAVRGSNSKISSGKIKFRIGRKRRNPTLATITRLPRHHPAENETGYRAIILPHFSFSKRAGRGFHTNERVRVRDSEKEGWKTGTVVEPGANPTVELDRHFGIGGAHCWNFCERGAKEVLAI